MYKYFHNKNIPVNVYLEPTLRCNLRCVHCYVEETISPAADELTRAEIDSVLKELADLGSLIMVVTGGEPFLRSDIMEILSDIRKHNFALVVFTNATLITPAQIDHLADLAPLSVEISLHGSCAIVHDAITGCSGSFDKTIAGVKRLRARGVSVKLKCSLMKANRGEHEKIMRLATELDTAYLFDHCIHPMRDRNQQPLECILDDEGIEAVYRDLRLIPLRAPKTQRTDPNRPLCGAARHVVRISSDGSVYPCIPLQIKAGNIRQQRIADIWNASPQFDHLRTLCQTDLKECLSCRLQPSCGRCMATAYTEAGDVLACSPVSRRMAMIRERVDFGIVESVA